MNIQNFVRIVFFLLSGFLIACTSQQITNIDADLKPISPKNVGYVFGTIGSIKDSDSESPYGVFGIYIQKKGTDDSVYMSYADDFLLKTEDDYSNEISSGALFSAELLPGEYEINHIFLTYRRGMTEVMLSTKDEFSIPFTIEKGSASYIGSFLAAGSWGKNTIGRRVPLTSAGYVLINNEINRDSEIFLKKNDRLNINIEQKVPDLPYSSEAFIRRQ